VQENDQRTARNPLHNDNPLKIGVFCQNLSGGACITLAEGTLSGDWSEQLEVARAADAAGWEFLIPIGRWRGYGGASDHHGRSLEVFTWAAGVAASTKQIHVFATAHVPIFHPLLAAKQGATIDQISNGRFGINVVAGWNAPELAMFGISQLPHDERYVAAEEWVTIVKRLWTEEANLDFQGKYYSMESGELRPKPISQPYPTLISAGQSTVGIEFAAKHMDFTFQAHEDVEELRSLVVGARELADREYHRKLGVLTYSMVVCRDTEKEAQDYIKYYVDEMGDWVAAQNVIDGFVAGDTRSLPLEVLKGMQRTMVAGWGGVPLVGTAEQIVAKLQDLHRIGVDGVAMTWVNYVEGIAQFNEEILPLMEEAGLRSPRPAT